MHIRIENDPKCGMENVKAHNRSPQTRDDEPKTSEVRLIHRNASGGDCRFEITVRVSDDERRRILDARPTCGPAERSASSPEWSLR